MMTTQLPNLPWEIIENIFSRLPSKSLMRFRCLSKLYRSLIDSPDFVKMHLNQSRVSQTNRSLILGFLGVYSVELDQLDCARILKPPFSSSDVSNSCNGLVLVGQNHAPFLWNPSTRKYKTLPDCPVESPHGIGVGERNYQRSGFGYIPEEDDYRVLRVVEFRDDDSVWVGSKAHIYSLKSDSWKKVDNFPYPLPRIRGWGVHVNGILHTVLSDYSGRFILAFDLRDCTNFVLPKPENLSPDADLSVYAMDGCLCLLATRKQRKTDIWIMKEYRVKESWTKLLSIGPPDIESHSLLIPLTYSKNGNQVLLNCNDEKLIWFDLKSKTAREVQVNGLPFRFYADVYVDSLIHLESGFNFGSGNGRDEVVMKRRAVRKEQRNLKEIRNKRDGFLSTGFKLVL
ncbi:OLC1v1020802C1 [Oldenlandia corymbosa var. corymbosa]|uniref:OLC1v1020802C1 n=1 Tax=Oldenlandia corymbosa var. corymbosa TaxID=529605 RepID=A0AAV1BUA5_OLDCO|nr:OLC1v1020802C1 [Oldenlandia corymbosa var. corymbosa]